MRPLKLSHFNWIWVKVALPLERKNVNSTKMIFLFGCSSFVFHSYTQLSFWCVSTLNISRCSLITKRKVTTLFQSHFCRLELFSYTTHVLSQFATITSLRQRCTLITLSFIWHAPIFERYIKFWAWTNVFQELVWPLPGIRSARRICTQNCGWIQCRQVQKATLLREALIGRTNPGSISWNKAAVYHYKGP